ncbi:MAG: SDR family NAD(P)-dependent oxidoreductase, partial [Stenotrophomonas sp.]
MAGADLAGRVILIAGAAGGLGAAATRACTAAGATVVMLGRKVAKLNRVYDSAAPLGAEPLLYPLDLEGAGPDDYVALAERLQDELGRLDGVLHCAADFAGLTPFALGDPAAFARAIHVNLTARAWLTQACLPLLRQRDDAAVVFALDDPQRVGQAYWGVYGVAQYGLRGLIESLHHAL